MKYEDVCRIMVKERITAHVYDMLVKRYGGEYSDCFKGFTDDIDSVLKNKVSSKPHMAEVMIKDSIIEFLMAGGFIAYPYQAKDFFEQLGVFLKKDADLFNEYVELLGQVLYWMYMDRMEYNKEYWKDVWDSQMELYYIVKDKE